MSEIVKIKIADIIIGKRKRQVFDDIPELAESIKTNGHLQPILIDSEMVLVAGERRIKAHELLGRDEIDAIIIPIDQISDRESLEYAENNDRADFTVSEKVDIAIAIEKKIKNVGERRGRKSKDVDSEEDKNMANRRNLPVDGENTRDFVAKRAGFKSTYAYRAAREVLEKAIPEVVAAMDKQEISIKAANDISQQPKKKQLTALNEAVFRPDCDGTALAKSQTERRAAKRKDKLGIPKKRLQHLCHRIIRIAPNWDSVVLSDIADIPVCDFADPQLAVVAVECDNRSLPDALSLLDGWGFDYVATVTIHNPKHIWDHLELTTATPGHIVFGIRRNNTGEIGDVARFSRLVKTFPVVSCKDTPAEACIHIIEAMFPDFKHDRRIDMTSLEPVKNWIVWKLTYGDPDAAAAHIAAVDAENAADDTAGTDQSGEELTTSDGVPVEQQETDIDLADVITEEPEETFEPQTKRNLSIFSD